MKVMLLGSGGREHAFAWKMAQSPRCQKLYIAPGNAGTAELGQNVPISPNDFPAVAQFALEKEVELVVVGPEEPLVRGIADFFAADPALQHIGLVGPHREGARLEGSKAFAKAFMQRHGIPTAAYREFSAGQLEEGLAYLAECPTPIVLKADGLAAGKGVLILDDPAEAQREFRAMLEGKFGAAGKTVVVEAFLSGREFSVFALTDGSAYALLPVAKDYKRVGEGDTGLNTGGMGSVSPVSFVDEALLQKVETRIVQPTMQGIREEGLRYRGFLFFGLIEVKGEPHVIEYNCRMGDPETQVVFPRLQNDLLELFEALLQGRLSQVSIEKDPQAAAAVILVSGGYPGPYEKGKAIRGLDRPADSLIFHAGTTRQGGEVRTSGGRVLAVTSLADTVSQALKTTYTHIRLIEFEGKYFRGDIGYDL